MRVLVDLDPDDLVATLVAELDHKKLFDLVKAIDDRVCDLKFTKDLAKHFKKVVDKERQDT